MNHIHKCYLFVQINANYKVMHIVVKCYRQLSFAKWFCYQNVYF